MCKQPYHLTKTIKMTIVTLMLFYILFVFSGALVAANDANLADQFDGLQIDPAYRCYLRNPRLSDDGNSIRGFQYLTQQEQYHLLHESGSCEYVLFHANELYEGQHPEKHQEALAIFKVVSRQESLFSEKRLANLPLSALEARFDPFRSPPRDLVRRKERHGRALDEKIAARKAAQKREEDVKKQEDARRAAQEPPQLTTEQVIENFRQKEGLLLTHDQERHYLKVATLNELEKDIQAAKQAGNDKLAEEIERCLRFAKKRRLKNT